jgi:carboxypeptidase PM20D1
MKKILSFLLVIILFVIGLVVFNTWTYPFSENTAKSNSPLELSPISETSLKRFAGGLRIPTISNADYEAFDYAPFDQFKAYLRDSYPVIFAQMEYDEVNGYGMIFRWKGKQADLKPILFLSHYDVVPVAGYDPMADTTAVEDLVFRPQDQASAPIDSVSESWDFPPFSGAIANGRIYGRGSLDMKNMLFAILEAAEKLMLAGYQPERDVYFAFGHDEEVGGRQGAAMVAADFKSKGIEFDAVFDEGGLISAKGSVGLLDKDIALVGMAEKGLLSLRIQVKGLGGHSSMPPLQSAIGKAAVIMQRLEENQMPAMLIPPMENFLNNVGGEMPFTSRMAIANRWLFESMLLNNFTKTPSTNALVRTTTALTMMSGSKAANVLESEVDFVANFRILPGNTVEDVKKHVEKACEGFEVRLEEVGTPREASNISPADTRGFEVIQETIGRIFPEAVATPYITIGGTDAYKYELVSKNVYRFLPVVLNASEQRTIHSENEYISIEAFNRMIHYFEEIMKGYDKVDQ